MCEIDWCITHIKTLHVYHTTNVLPYSHYYIERLGQKNHGMITSWQQNFRIFSFKLRTRHRAVRLTVIRKPLYHNIITGYNQYLHSICKSYNGLLSWLFLIGCSDWIGYWGKHMKATAFKSVREYQKVRRLSKSQFFTVKTWTWCFQT